MLYTQIASNKRMTVFIVIGFMILTLLTGAFASYYFFGDFLAGAVAVAIGMMFYLPITIFTAKKSVLRMNNAKKIDSNSKEYKQLFNIVESLCIPAQLPTPEIYIIHEESPNAFATGISPENSAVAVTTGLLNILNREELEGVIAHELAHIRNYDIRLSTIAFGLVSILILLADIVTSVFGVSSNNKNPLIMIFALIFVMLSPLLGQIVQLTLSRNREYLADATAVKFSRNPIALASALMKIAQHSRGMQTSKSTNSMFIANPSVNYLKSSSIPNIEQQAASLSNEQLLALLKEEKTNLFSTHPTIYSRIDRLSKM